MVIGHDKAKGIYAKQPGGKYGKITKTISPAAH